MKSLLFFLLLLAEAALSGGLGAAALIWSGFAWWAWPAAGACVALGAAGLVWLADRAIDA